MALVYFAYSSNYKELRLSSAGYPSGTYKGVIDTTIDPEHEGVEWHGYFASHAAQVQNVYLEDEIYVDYAQSWFEGFTSLRGIQSKVGDSYEYSLTNLRGNLLNCKRMFYNTPLLATGAPANNTKLVLEKLVSINCLNAEEMFAGCGA